MTSKLENMNRALSRIKIQRALKTNGMELICMVPILVSRTSPPPCPLQLPQIRTTPPHLPLSPKKYAGIKDPQPEDTADYIPKPKYDR